MANNKSKKDKPSLDHNSSVPFFIQIAETMKRRIVSGQYNPGKQLFTGEELEREFQTSNITIRKAMEKLKNDGFVERRRGLGTTVSKIYAGKDDIINTIEQAMGIKIHKVNQTLKSVVVDLDISSVLDISFGAPLFFNESTYHSVSGETLFLSQSYFRGDMFAFRTTSLL